MFCIDQLETPRHGVRMSILVNMRRRSPRSDISKIFLVMEIFVDKTSISFWTFRNPLCVIMIFIV